MEKRHKKHFKSWLVSSIVCIAFMYLLGSFVMLDFNIINWSAWIRFSFAVCSVISLASVASISIKNFQLEEFELKREKRDSLSEGKKSGFRKLLDKQLEEAKEQRAKLKNQR